MFEYTLIRSKRKTVALYVRDGRLVVRAPLKMPKDHIDKFIASKEKWVQEKLAKTNAQLELRESFCLNYGDNVTYRGKLYPIVAGAGNYIGFDDEGFYMPPDLSPVQIKDACVQIYHMLAKRDLTKKVLDYTARMGVVPSGIKISAAHSRWGSCSSRNSINFSWRLIMADDDVIDYVVVHELAHIIEMNHSERFWSLVERILPDFRERKSRLKELQRRLKSENWK